MLGSQPMTHVLCQVVAYLPLEDNDEHKMKEVSLSDKDFPHPLIEYASDDEDID
jgi:hypothetical protein